MVVERQLRDPKTGKAVPANDFQLLVTAFSRQVPNWTQFKYTEKNRTTRTELSRVRLPVV